MAAWGRVVLPALWVAVSAVFVFAEPPKIGRIVEVQGGGLSVGRGQTSSRAVEGESLTISDRLASASDGHSLLEVGGGRMNLAPDTAFDLVPQKCEGERFYFCFDFGTARVRVDSGVYELDLGRWILEASADDLIIFKDPGKAEFWIGVLSGSVRVHAAGSDRLSSAALVVSAGCEAVLDPAEKKISTGTLRFELGYWLRRRYPLDSLLKEAAGAAAASSHPRETRAP